MRSLCRFLSPFEALRICLYIHSLVLVLELDSFAELTVGCLKIFVICLTMEFARNKGRDNVTLDDLVNVLTPKGRGGFLPSSIVH